MLRNSVGYGVTLGIQKCSEFTFQPFGYLLVGDSEPTHKVMCDISIFGNCKYDEKVQGGITTS